MAQFPIRRYRLVKDPFDQCFGDQLDFFDPWIDFDQLPSNLSVKSNAFQWINKPQRSTNTLTPPIIDEKTRPSLMPAINSKKFRIQLNIAGFEPKTVSTRIDGQRVIVEAKHEDRPDAENNNHIQPMHKIYDLPDFADLDHFTSYITPNHILVIEVPVCNPRTQRRPSLTINENQDISQFGENRDPSYDYSAFLIGTDFQPHLIEKSDNQKQLEMSVDMKNYQPEEIKVLVKNNRLMVQGEHKFEDNNRSERSFFFKSLTLPPGTQMDQLKSQLTNEGQLKIEGPFIEPIE